MAESRIERLRRINEMGGRYPQLERTDIRDLLAVMEAAKHYRRDSHTKRGAFSVAVALDKALAKFKDA